MKNAPMSGKRTEQALIFTDLDGSLLDHHSYDWDKAKPALDFCRRKQVPVILVSSKTRAELDVLRQEMDLPFPFISENGGGVFLPKEWTKKAPPGAAPEGDVLKLSLGVPYDVLVKSLREIRDELGWRITGFSEMTLEEVSKLTGLDMEGSRLASMREFDEPFVLRGQDISDMGPLHAAAEKKGLRVTKGGRFCHIHGKIDKGEAVRMVIALYREFSPHLFTVALGDSPNDFSMFKQVDQPVLIRSNQEFSAIEEEFPGLLTTGAIGPEGWNHAVLNILGKRIEEGIS